MSMHASLTSILDRAPVQSASDERYRPLVWKVALVLAIAMTAAAAAMITAPFSTAAQMDPDLVRLLRAMVAVKGIIALAAASLVFRRLGQATPRAVALGYGAAIGVSVSALVWLWGLASILAGAFFFYGGLVGLLLVARVDLRLWAVRGHRP
jgi:hypothetical protein